MGTDSSTAVRFSSVRIPLLCYWLILAGCTTVAREPVQLPPILEQDELLKPYSQLGTVEVTRKVFGDVAPDSPELAQGKDALRAEAHKLGADAVIQATVLEIRRTFIVIPYSELRANGIAIKFR